MIFIDLDHFNALTGELGHNTSDKLLERIAGRSSESVRPGDTVARIGGDEFASWPAENSGVERATRRIVG